MTRETLIGCLLGLVACGGGDAESADVATDTTTVDDTTTATDTTTVDETTTTDSHEPEVEPEDDFGAGPRVGPLAYDIPLAWQAPATLAILPDAEDRFDTRQDTITLTGALMASGPATTVGWRVRDAQGVERGAGSGRVEGVGRYVIDELPLTPGLNTVSLTAQDGAAVATAEHTIRRTSLLAARDGFITPSRLAVGQRATVHFEAALEATPSALDRRSLELALRGPGGAVRVLGPLRDDGAGGDELPLDGVYGADLEVDADVGGTWRALVRGRPAGGGPLEESEIGDLHVVVPPTVADIAALADVHRHVNGVFWSHLEALGPEAAFERAAAAARRQPGVAEVVADPPNLMLRHDSGLPLTVPLYPEGSKGGVPEHARVLFFDTRFADFSGAHTSLVTIAETSSSCPGWSADRSAVGSARATMPNLPTVGRGGIVVFDSHGALSIVTLNRPPQPVFLLHAVVDPNVEDGGLSAVPGVTLADLAQPAPQFVIAGDPKAVLFYAFTSHAVLARLRPGALRRAWVHLASCHGGGGRGELMRAFLQRGAALVDGWSKKVSAGGAYAYFENMQRCLFRGDPQIGKPVDQLTYADCHAIKAFVDPGDGASVVVAGDRGLSFQAPVGGLGNGDFEAPDLGQWRTSGSFAARRSSVGALTPLSGGGMGFVHTGIGNAYERGRGPTRIGLLSQRTCLPPRAEPGRLRLRFKWRVVTNEVDDFCATHEDELSVVVTRADDRSRSVAFRKKVADWCGLPHERSPIQIVDPACGTTDPTRVLSAWQSAELDLDPLRVDGATRYVEVDVQMNGNKDTVCHSGAMIDDVELVREQP
ncbi:MAG: hypothetical protein IT385_14930 [Deltaproteobacteria bacterium]|nr:hypothetical protein [Deltaproteobacteria bacterium]